LDPGHKRGDGDRVSIRLPAERQRQEQIANRLDPKLLEPFSVGVADVGQARDQPVKRARKGQYAQGVIPPPPTSDGEPERATGRSGRLRTTIIAAAVIVIVLIGIIGYAVTGLSYAQTRVGNADKTLNTVVSHQNSLNTTFTDLNSKFNSLSSSQTLDPLQARKLFDQFVTNEKAVGVSDDQDEASLAAAKAGLNDQSWLTLIARANLDREATRIDHARKALSIARTAAAGYVQDGQFFQSYFNAEIDVDMFTAQVATVDLAAAKTTLTSMKAHIDTGLQLSSAPGLPGELHSLMLDLGTLVTDFGKLLDAALAGDDASVNNAYSSVEADATKLGTYNVDKIMSEIAAYYKPMFDAINSEMAKAAA
jgi:hypothetical protein